VRPSLRFLALAVVGWGGFRAWSVGALPGAPLIEQSAARPAPPIVQTEFPPFDPPPPAEPQPEYASAMPYGVVPQFVPAQVRPVAVPIYYGVGSVRVPLPPARPAPLANVLPEPRPPIYSGGPTLDESPMSRLASLSLAQQRSSVVVTPGQSTPVWKADKRLDRVQASAWALVRGQQGQPLGPTSLASGGQLGGSQAGARIIYNFTRQVAASVRTTTPVGRRGGEVAAGVRVQPVGGIPVWVTAERRQQLGRYGGGRNAFAIFAEGGVYQRPMPWRFTLDAYLQGGIVGLRSRDAFVDGALTVTRPVFKQFSAGFGLWGGGQPGIYRVDAGPRVTMQMRRNMRVHFDWRQKLAGNAQPGSGPAVTLAGDF
jgi:hypothetical protein